MKNGKGNKNRCIIIVVKKGIDNITILIYNEVEVSRTETFYKIKIVD